jgi:hypothetical protein
MPHFLIASASFFSVIKVGIFSDQPLPIHWRKNNNLTDPSLARLHLHSTSQSRSPPPNHHPRTTRTLTHPLHQPRRHTFTTFILCTEKNAQTSHTRTPLPELAFMLSHYKDPHKLQNFSVRNNQSLFLTVTQTAAQDNHLQELSCNLYKDYTLLLHPTQELVRFTQLPVVARGAPCRGGVDRNRFVTMT